MASRAQMKEEARARRVAEQEAAAEKARRQRRIQSLGGILAVAVIAVVVLIAISSGSSPKSHVVAPTSPKASQTSKQVDTMLAGIPQNGATLGDPKAPVSVTYYGDLECPICADFTLTGGWPQLVANEIKRGKVKVTYSGFETATRDPQTFQTQQIAALSAGMQNKFWQFVELFYHEQGTEGSGYVTEAYLDGLAKQIAGLNYNTWLADRKNPALLAQVQNQSNQGSSAGVNATPTLVFVGPKGKYAPAAGPSPYSDLQTAVAKVG